MLKRHQFSIYIGLELGHHCACRCLSTNSTRPSAGAVLTTKKRNIVIAFWWTDDVIQNGWRYFKNCLKMLIFHIPVPYILDLNFLITVPADVLTCNGSRPVAATVLCAKLQIRTVCQNHVSRAGTSNYIPQYLWDVITCPCPWYLLQAHKSLYVLYKISLPVNDPKPVFMARR